MKIRACDIIEIVSESERFKAQGARIERGDISADCELRGDTLGVSLTADSTPIKYVVLKWKTAPRAKAVKVFSDTWERGYGEMGWYPIIPHRRMPWVFAVSDGSDSVFDARGRLTECFGVKVRPSALSMWQYESGLITLTLDVRSGGSGVLLGGRKLNVCEIKMSDYADISAFSALKSFYKTLCDDPLLPKHSVYGSNNWYYAYGSSSRGQIVKDARLISELAKGLSPRPYMVIDAGWSECPGSGPWDHGNPDYGDMRSLAAEIERAGAIPGIWVRYLSDEDGHMKNVPDEWRSKRNHKYLDPSHPEVLEYVKRTTRRLSAEWGYRLIKHDFSCFDAFGDWGCNRPETLTDDGWSFYDGSKTSAEIMVNFYRAIYEAAAPETIILACNVPGFLTAGLCHINRAGDDTSGKDWERTRRMGVNTAACRAMCDGAFYKADYDCVGIMGIIPWSLNQKWARLLSYTGTPVFFSTDPDKVSEDEKRDISACLARAAAQTSSAIPLDWMETTCPERWLIDGKEERFELGEE